MAAMAGSEVLDRMSLYFLAHGRLYRCPTAQFFALFFDPALFPAQQQAPAIDTAYKDGSGSRRQSEERETVGSVGPNMAKDIGDLNQKHAAPKATHIKIHAPARVIVHQTEILSACPFCSTQRSGEKKRARSKHHTDPSDHDDVHKIHRCLHAVTSGAACGSRAIF